MPTPNPRQVAFVQAVLATGKQACSSASTIKLEGKGHAPVNIALSKYWGKRDTILNLPQNGSVSISLPGLGTDTTLRPLASDSSQQVTAQDRISLNGQQLDAHQPFAHRLSQFLDLFRTAEVPFFEVITHNTVPTAAGLASSASGYAALVLALDDLFNWQLPATQLSLLARLGSGSASRSLFPGFAIWHAGQSEQGLDSFAEALDAPWPDFCVGLVEIDVAEKPVGSTAGMQQTTAACALYSAWPAQAERDKAVIINAIQQQDFSQLGATAEHNALSMHATMIASWPPLLYWQAESVIAMQKVWALRQQGVEVYFTMDAGPNLKLLFLAAQKKAVSAAFSGLKVIEPFAKPDTQAAS
ncbi:diphosphomevalonate decarboxylase [Thiomicrospira aerophila AL3]|uniref:diphosphomevalonate decarboxylase n=1 Tax=Thiomicrospira aerophila AL3 TaxID=717772 RepID=W0DY15_9GAMM|nr:diphosphomevalonate decarboxylase [Thiomicrospira aerophila]AHF01884.1 diphosphomevalonate decarboxylase [Thiomicrospira aerophila AL3]